MRFKYIFSFAAIILTACGTMPVAPVAQDVDLSAVKNYALDQATEMKVAAVSLVELSQKYFDLIEQDAFDYQKSWQYHGAELIDLTDHIKDSWLDASFHYESNEGIIAGVPSLADFDVWLDAGPSADEDPVEARDWSLKLADGRELLSPGNFFHHLLEPTIWGTNKDFVGVAVDMDEDGVLSVGEVLPDAYVLLAAAQGLDEANAEMIAAVNAWQPTEEDVFTALVTMIPTMNEYFNQWSDSYFIVGDGTGERAFVAVSRLVDVKGILNGLDLAYDSVSPLVADSDQALDVQISTGFDALIGFVDGIYLREESGEVFDAQAAEQLGEEAQRLADVLVGQVSSAAAVLDLELN